MKKVTTLVLMFFLVLSGAFCYAHSAARTENMKGNDGIPIELIERSTYTSSEKGNSIIASIDGHYLTVTFTQDIGAVTMELDKVSGPVIFSFQTVTPDSFGFYLNQTGDYIITFTLANGDEYYGEFTITD